MTTEFEWQIVRRNRPPVSDFLETRHRVGEDLVDIRIGQWTYAHLQTVVDRCVEDDDGPQGLVALLKQPRIDSFCVTPNYPNMAPTGTSQARTKYYRCRQAAR
jgi:hypothetical protein